MKLEVGQRIEVYKAITDGYHTNGDVISGTFRPCVFTDIIGLVGILPNKTPLGSDTRGCLMALGSECRPVGAMIIKSVK